ncbi:MAG: CopG family transcriptional regulator [Desulfovermiculus sp.]
MGQVTIYLDPETERKLQAFLEGRKISKSKWISSLIKEKTSAEWPERIKRLARGLEGFP